MSCIAKIKNYTAFTKTEIKLADYIVQHMDEVIYDTAQVLSKKTSTSPAALIRFSQKLGYKGFTDLKVDLAQESDVQQNDDIFGSIIDNHDRLEDVMKNKMRSDDDTIKQTFQLLHKDNLQKAIECLKQAEKIYLFGISASAICCTDFAQKLSRIGIDVICYNDVHMQLAATSHIRPCDVALAVSYSGHTKEVNIAMKQAKKAGARTIAITQISNTPLQKLADILLYLPTQEHDLRLGAMVSRNASLILTDLLYLGMIKDDLDDYKEKLKKSRILVKQLHDS